MQGGKNGINHIGKRTRKENLIGGHCFNKKGLPLGRWVKLQTGKKPGRERRKIEYRTFKEERTRKTDRMIKTEITRRV